MSIKIPFPSALAPSSMTRELISNTSSFDAALTGTTVTVENPGIRWKFVLNYDLMDFVDATHSYIVEAITRLRGKGGRLQIHNMDQPESSGVLDVSNKVNNSNFLLSGSGWTESLGTGGSVNYKQNSARLVRGSAGFTQLSQSVSLIDGVVYSAHVALKEGTHDKITVNIGTTDGSSNIATATYTGSGRYELLFVAGATNFISAIIESTASVGDFITISDVRVSRACRTDGVDQTGTKIQVSDLPASTENLLKSLDFVGINGELKRLVDYVDSDSSGNATLIIEPPMIRLIPDNSLVVFNRPFTKMILEEDRFSENISIPVLSSFSLSMVEDLT